MCRLGNGFDSPAFWFLILVIRACSLLKLAFDPKSVKFVKWVYEKLTCLAHCSILPTKTFMLLQ